MLFLKGLVFFCLNFFFVVLFAQAYYLFYFLSISLVLYFLKKYQCVFGKKELILSAILSFISFLLYDYFDDFVYNFLVDCEIEDILFYLPSTILYLLTLLHLFILFLLGYNKTKKSKARYV
jgi:hypothetical protein